ncbi:MAG: ElyC/SanA/YdcF family protein [Chloroflexota bacterium]
MEPLICLWDEPVCEQNRSKIENMWQAIRKLFIRLFVLGLVILSLPFIWRALIVLSYSGRIQTAESVEPARVVIVFGAGIRGNAYPSDVLRDRLDVAIELYKTGKVERLLLTGDNSFENYNEPGVMAAYAESQGVPLAHIQQDFGGRRTYDSCYRAKHIFGLEDAILVTQQFHMPRALFLCRSMNINASGVTADVQSYIRIRWFQVREIGATAQAALDVIRMEPPPVMGEPILID